MSLHLPARRLALTVRATAGQPCLHLQYLQPRTQRRNAWSNFGGSKKKDTPAPKSLSEELSKREKEQRLLKALGDNTQGQSIFDEEIKESERQAKEEAKRDAAGGPQSVPGMAGPSRLKEHMQRALDPDPRWRIRYQKRHVAAMMRKKDNPLPARLARAEHNRRTEREVTSASEILPTSTKKLVHLAHQIVGKPVDEAIVQMRYSKKRMAREVRFQLELARDQAVAAHGMGLGAAPGNEDQLLRKPRQIQTKDGRWFEVADPTRLYVDESWVNKSNMRGRRVNYGARGRMSMMMKPTTRIWIKLKEEKTRIRKHDEKLAKEAKKLPWVHLPNRPVTAQRPYYSW